ncbi:MAG: glycosyltransferase family 2 protein [Deltaproteobacteria bacterium]|nr:glycosyltransferase family 2 protein [Deltaproteobacteria bacterium]
MADQDGIDLSIVIPLKDESDNIGHLADELTGVLERHPWSWECIWVDDGSTDDTLSILKGLVQKDPRHRYISFEKNAGQSAAFYAGFEAARGATLATIDGDGQNDPAGIPSLVEMVESGECDMANGYRARRQDTLVRKLSSRIANAFRNWVTGKTVRDVGCSTRVFRRECIESLPPFKGMHRFLPTLVGIRGFRLAEAPVEHRPRVYGKTKYSINNRLWVGLMDTFGVLWLRKRAFRYIIQSQSDE